MKFEDLNVRIGELLKIQGTKKIGFTFGTLTSYNHSADYYLTPVRTASSIVYSGAIVRNVEIATEIARTIEDVVDYIFVDSEKKIAKTDYGKNDVGNIEKALISNLKHLKVLTYKGNDLTVRAADTLLRVLTPNLTGAKIAIIGVGNIGMKLGMSLVERGNNVVFFSLDENHARDVTQLINRVKFRTTLATANFTDNMNDAMKNADITIATSDRKQIISKQHVNQMNVYGAQNSRILLDVGKGCFKQEVFETNGLIYRVDIGEELSCELENLISQQEKVRETEGITVVDGVRFVRKGIAGKKGDYIIDRFENSTRIIGICDDLGNLVPIEFLEMEKAIKLFGAKK